MQRRQVILGAVFILVIIGCATAAWLVWQQQRRAALIAASVPEVPDLSRWPVEFSRAVQEATGKARMGDDPIESLSRLAFLYLGNSYVDQAKLPLAALCRLEPENARWRYLMGDAHMRLGETNAAEADFQLTTKLDPKYTMAWIRLGFLRSQRGAVIEAHECYDNAAASDPDDLLAAYLLIVFEARNHRAVDARRRMADFSRKHPGFKETHESLAELYAEAGDAVAAEKERRLASATNQQLPTKDPWIDQLAEYCFEADRLRTLSATAFCQGKLDAAVNLLKRAIQIAPTEPLMRDALYSVYEAMGRPQDALRTLQQAVIECPDDANLYVQLSRLLCSLHRSDEAVASLQPAVQRWPENAQLRAALGFALSNAGKDERAVTELQEAIRLDSTLVEERYNLGIGLLKLGRRDAARDTAQKALEMRPDYTDAMALLGMLALDEGDLAAAEPMVSRLYALQPEDQKSQSLFCGLQLLKGAEAERTGNLVAAEELYRSGLAVNPKYVRLLRAMGLLAMRQGKFPNAAESFRGYLHANPKDSEAYFLLGQALRKAGHSEEGIKMLQQGLMLEQQTGSNAMRVEAFKRALEQK